MKMIIIKEKSYYFSFYLNMEVSYNIKCMPFKSLYILPLLELLFSFRGEDTDKSWHFFQK